MAFCGPALLLLGLLMAPGVQGGCVEVDSETEAVLGAPFKLLCIACKRRSETPAEAEGEWFFRAEGAPEFTKILHYTAEEGAWVAPGPSQGLLWVPMGPYGSLWSLYGSLCISMGPFVSLWISVCPYGFLCVAVRLYGSLCVSLWDPYGSLWSLYGSLCISMGPYGSLWVPMCPYGSLWVSMCPYGSLWVSMCPSESLFVPCVPMGSLCVPMGPYGVSMGHCASLCVPMRPYGFLCVPMGLCGSLCDPMDPYGFLWVPMGFYVSLCVPMGFYGSLCVPMDPYGSHCAQPHTYGSPPPPPPQILHYTAEEGAWVAPGPFEGLLFWNGSRGTRDIQDLSVRLSNVGRSHAGLYVCRLRRNLTFEGYTYSLARNKSVKLAVVESERRDLASIVSEVLMYVLIVLLTLWLAAEMLYCYRKVAAASAPPPDSASEYLAITSESKENCAGVQVAE
uniref:Sodium voltage-gated channel beta subunit 1 n=1 Tax=Gallus gallus TaxID=9031 RepID=A0A8V0X8B6_CHICK